MSDAEWEAGQAEAKAISHRVINAIGEGANPGAAIMALAATAAALSAVNGVGLKAARGLLLDTFNEAFKQAKKEVTP